MPRKKNKFYFDENVDVAIELYNETNDDDEKKYIYETEIKKPLEKLAQNILNSFKFMYVNDNFSTKKDDLVGYLITILDKCNRNNGKAFSYLSVSAKNYMIINNNANYKKIKLEFNVDEYNESAEKTKDIPQLQIVDTNIINDDITKDTNEFINQLIKYLNKNICFIFKRVRDIEIANAIVQILINKDTSLDTYNKKEVYVLIREQVQCTSVDISSVLNILRRLYKYLINDYYTYGELNYKKVYCRYGTI